MSLSVVIAGSFVPLYKVKTQGHMRQCANGANTVVCGRWCGLNTDCVRSSINISVLHTISTSQQRICKIDEAHVGQK